MKRRVVLIIMIAALISLWGEALNIAPQPFECRVLSSDSQQTTLQLHIGSLDRTPVTIDGSTYEVLTLAGESNLYTTGVPDLPKVTRSLVIGNDAHMTVRVVDENFVEYPMQIAPSKGPISRSIDPATVPYSFGEAYRNDAFYPASGAALGRPYIMRDVRGIAVDLFPVRYNPMTGTVRVCTEMTVQIYRNGTDTDNVKTRGNGQVASSYLDIYRNHFVNWGNTRYTSIGEQGSMLVLCYSSFCESMQPFVNWKNQKGLPTELVDISTVGTTSTAIKSYIQTRYNEGNLAYVLLVGDSQQVPTFTVTQGGADPMYSLLEGDDNYPEIFVGRFSAENLTQLETQIQRTITYERDLADGEWLHKGVGIASEQGMGSGDDGESDWQHMNNIRTDLLGYNYTAVDQIYQTLGNASVATVNTSLNDGRSIINYCGHGSDTAWSTTGYSVSDINNTTLANDNMLPFIVSVACYNGNFVGRTCFGEGWLRAVNTSTGQPKGAIGAYMSSISQDWDPPMCAQDEITDLLIAEEKLTYGGLCYNGSCQMMDEYGASTTSSGAQMFLTWIIFGDPSLLVRTNTPEPFVADYNEAIIVGSESFTLQTNQIGALACLSYNNEIVSSGYTGENGNLTMTLGEMPEAGSLLTLTLTGYNMATLIDSISYLPATGAYLQVERLRTPSSVNLVYGQTSTLSINIENMGVSAATGVTATLSTDDPFITIDNGVAELGNIEPNSTPSFEGVFTVTPERNVTDQHRFAFTVTLTATNGDTWDGICFLTVDAPSVTPGVFVIDDSQGNADGSADPGETISCTLPINNTGHAELPAGTWYLGCNNGLVTISTTEFEVPAIPDSEACNITFSANLDSGIPLGTYIPVGLTLVSPDFTFSQRLGINVGAVYENFEGNMSGLPWNLYPSGSNAPWSLSSTSPFEGNTCLSSGTVTHSQNSAISVTVTLGSAGNITFAHRESSEEDFDELTFSIDGVYQAAWSGEADWEQSSFAVTAGTHTFLWDFDRDYSGDGGLNRVWIDDITFPSNGSASAPLVCASSTKMVFLDAAPGSPETQQLILFNMGTESLTGTITTPQWVTFTDGARMVTRNASRTDHRDTYEINLAPGEFRIVSVQFAPENSEDYTQSITITSNDPVMPTYSIRITNTTVGTQTDNVPSAATRFNGNYPNPFNPETTLSYTLGQNSDVTLVIYNIKGQAVRTLVKESQTAGNHTVRWNGTDDNGRPVGSGMYFGRFNSHSKNDPDKDDGKRFTSTKKMILLK
jgi:hypothetical protein